MKSNHTLQEYLIHAAETYPDNIAVKYGTVQVTYQELLDKSRKIASSLKKMGITRKEQVLFYCGKSDIAVETVFGVLLSGNAYIPIDIKTPVYRCMVLVRESKSNYFVTEGNDLNRLVEDELFDRETFGKIHILVLDSEYQYDKEIFADYKEAVWAEEPLNLLEEQQDEESTAYILYTSGSTGVPKGVVLTHRNAVSFVDWCLEYFKPKPGERFLSVAPFHFDLSVFDLYVSIASGGCLVILPREVEQNILRRIQYISKEKINYIYSVPSLWIAIIRYGKIEKGSFSEIQKVLFAGEIFQPGDLRQTMELVPQAEFYNLYGLIETNVITCYKVEREKIQKEEPVPIGYSCSSAELLVMKEGKPVMEEGTEGELYVAGPTVMKEYFGKKKLTDKVIANIDGKRYFRTGDMVKWGKNGELILLGRNDFMVKRDGYRIELTEIESVLSRLDCVYEAAVVAVRDEEQKVCICAAVLAGYNQKIKVLDLKKKLGRILPGYMIPDWFSVMKTFPRSISGKVDRSYLVKYFIENIKKK